MYQLSTGEESVLEVEDQLKNARAQYHLENFEYNELLEKFNTTKDKQQYMEAELKAMIARRLADVDDYKMQLAKLKKKSKTLDEEIGASKEQTDKVKQDL